MDQTEVSRSWFWNRAFVLLGACIIAGGGFALAVKGTSSINSPGAIGEAVGAGLGIWAIGGVVPLVAFLAKKPSRKSLLMIWTIASAALFILVSIGKSADFKQVFHSSREISLGYNDGGYLYCGQNWWFDIHKNTGPPEAWSRETIRDVQTHTKELALNNPNYDFTVEEIPLDFYMRYDKTGKDKGYDTTGKFVIPCAILFGSKKQWDEYWEQKLEEKRTSERRYKIFMACLYEHRKEMNDQNKATVTYKCQQIYRDR